MKRRMVQRSPDTGLKIRMVRPAASCCVPEIGAAYWYNRITNAYDLTTIGVSRSASTDYPYPVTAVQPLGYAARVTGTLCDCQVAWEVSLTLAAFGESPLGDVLPGLTDFVEVLQPDRALVIVVKPELLLYDTSGHVHFNLAALQAGGIVTATPTVTCGTASTVLAPIHLVLQSTAGGGCC